VATDEVREASQSHASDSPSSGEGRMPEWPDQTKNIVKFYLTDHQGLRLLCIGGRCNLFTVRSIRLLEKAHDKRNTYDPDRAGAVRRRRHDGFGSCFPVCDAGGLAGVRARRELITSLSSVLPGDVDS
jgi:hypothetical protein